LRDICDATFFILAGMSKPLRLPNCDEQALLDQVKCGLWSARAEHRRGWLKKGSLTSTTAAQIVMLIEQFGIMLRLSNSLFMQWSGHKRRPDHVTTTDFQSALSEDHHRPALRLAVHKHPDLKRLS
jgi:hypothetical protein